MRRAFNLRIYRLSIIVLIVTPLLAVVLKYLKAWPQIAPSVHLPLTMVLTYLAAVLLLVCRFTYDFACPKIIHDFSDYPSFISSFACPAVEIEFYLGGEIIKRMDYLGPPRELVGIDREALRVRVKEIIHRQVTPTQVTVALDEITHRVCYELIVRVVDTAQSLPLWAIYISLVLAGLLVASALVLQFLNVMSVATL